MNHKLILNFKRNFTIPAFNSQMPFFPYEIFNLIRLGLLNNKECQLQFCVVNVVLHNALTTVQQNKICSKPSTNYQIIFVWKLIYSECVSWWSDVKSKKTITKGSSLFIHLNQTIHGTYTFRSSISNNEKVTNTLVQIARSSHQDCILTSQHLAFSDVLFLFHNYLCLWLNLHFLFLSHR